MIRENFSPLNHILSIKQLHLTVLTCTNFFNTPVKLFIMSTEELGNFHSSPISTSANNNVKRCLKSLKGIRRLKNNGAILVAIWSYLVTGVYYYMRYVGSRNYSTVTFSVTQAVVGLMLPLLGWLADVHFGRYKIISCSLWLLWISCMLYTAALVISEVTYLKFEHDISAVLLVVTSIGYCGFQANIVQFGTDQLIDASSIETKTFITWCTWTFFAGEVTLHFFLTCVDNKLFPPLLFCCTLTVVVIINILFKQVLIKEPPTQNPFKLVYKVLVYAIKNKYPQQISAFTYCEDGIPSRIDFGKRKYGGPFTTEQVEDVKTLFRVAILCIVAGAIFALAESWSSMKLAVNTLFRNEDNIKTISCSSEYIIIGMYYISGTILIPLYEFLIYPIFCRSINITSTWKVVMGAIIGMVKLIGYTSLIIKARHNHLEIDSNSTLLCSFHEPPGVLGTYIDYRWTAILKFLNAVSDILIIIGMLEFYSAQVPYSMKGVLAGIAYSTIVLYLLVFYAIEKLFEKPSFTWGTGVISCEFWYFVTLLSLLTMLLVVSFIALKWYKKRKREDVLPNEQIFAERYYSY